MKFWGVTGTNGKTTTMADATVAADFRETFNIERYFSAQIAFNLVVIGNDLTDATRTVAYGTFTMKYNASASKKLSIFSIIIPTN